MTNEEAVLQKYILGLLDAGYSYDEVIRKVNKRTGYIPPSDHGGTRYAVALDEFRREARDSGGEGRDDA